MREEFIEIYTKWFEEWKKRHPNLKVLWCVLHFDETNGTPHMHLAVCPICHNFKRGPKMQVSMSKALEDDGFGRSESRKEGYQLERAFSNFRVFQEATLHEIGYCLKPRTDKKHEDAELFRETEQSREELEHNKKAIDFTDSVKKEINKEAEKVIDYDSSRIIKTTHKATILSKSEDVYIVPAEIYESQQAMQNIKRLSEMAVDAAEKTKRICDKTLASIESDANQDLQQKVDRLEKEVAEQRAIIMEKDKKIKNLSSIIDTVKEFIREHNLVLMWKRFLEKQKQHEQEREDRTR